MAELTRKGLKESVTLTDEAVITSDEGQERTVVQFTAHIPNNGISGNIQTSIRDIQAYEENRTAIRRIQRDFEDDVWGKEDEMATE